MRFLKAISLMVVVLLGAGQVSPARGWTLYGWTRSRDGAGNVDFVKIGTADGQAHILFSIAIPANYEARDLTYDPTRNRFYGSVWDGGTGFLAEINASTESALLHPFSNLPRPPIEGMEYFKEKDGVVVTGQDATGQTNALLLVSSSGVVQEAAYLPGIADQDHLFANSLGGNLHVQDVNNPTGGYKLNAWNDPFGATPTLTGVYNGPVTGSEADMAVHPPTNRFYVSQLSRLSYYDTSLQQQQVIGDFNYAGRQIWGIAFGPDTLVPVEKSSWGQVKSLYK